MVTIITIMLLCIITTTLCPWLVLLVVWPPGQILLTALLVFTLFIDLTGNRARH